MQRIDLSIIAACALCAVGLFLVSCGDSGGGGSSDDASTQAGGGADPDPEPSFFYIGGTVDGFDGSTYLILQNNNTDDLEIGEDGEFTFVEQVEDGGAFAVSVLTKSDWQICTIGNANGIVNGAAITDVEVTCSDNTAPGTGWVAVSAGLGHTAALRNDGGLWVWGQDKFGVSHPHFVPVQVDRETIWTAVASGRGHTIALKEDGSLWAWGSNQFGQLGDGTVTQRQYPVQSGGDTNWTTIEAGENFNIAMKSDGSLWTWGDNEFGQLGLGDDSNRTVPSRVGIDTDWAAGSAGLRHVLALKTNGTLWSWGSGTSGNSILGLGENVSDANLPIQVGEDIEWAAVYAGREHSIALKINGTLWAWGWNSSGELGLGIDSYPPIYYPTQVGADTDWIAVSTGNSHTLALKNSGTLWAWGTDHFEYGKLGLGDIYHENEPTQVGIDTNWTNVSTGESHSNGLKSNSTMWVWGSWSALGLGFDSDNKFVPTQYGEPASDSSGGTGDDTGGGGGDTGGDCVPCGTWKSPAGLNTIVFSSDGTGTSGTGTIESISFDGLDVCNTSFTWTGSSSGTLTTDPWSCTPGVPTPGPSENAPWSVSGDTLTLGSQTYSRQ